MITCRAVPIFWWMVTSHDRHVLFYVVPWYIQSWRDFFTPIHHYQVMSVIVSQFLHFSYKIVNVILLFLFISLFWLDFAVLNTYLSQKQFGQDLSMLSDFSCECRDMELTYFYHLLLSALSLGSLIFVLLLRWSWLHCD